MRGGQWLVCLLVMLLCSCSSPEKHSSGEGPAADSAAYYIPKDAASAAGKKNPHVDTVKITGLKFLPEQIDVNKGDTVIWINNDLVMHCVTEARNMNWTSYQIPAGGSWKKAFSQSSDYYCTIHQVMKGKIVVTDSATALLQ